MQQPTRPHPSAAAAQVVKPVRIAPRHSFSGRRARTKKEQLSPRKPLPALFFFVPGAARFFFSRERKRNVGRNRSPPLPRGAKPAAPLWGATVPPLSKRSKTRPAAGH